MNFPEIPTDNLYKFLAVSGIILIIISIGALFYQMINISFDQTEISYKLNLAEIELKQISNELIFLESVMDEKLAVFPDTLIAVIDDYVDNKIAESIDYPSIARLEYYLELGSINDSSMIVLLKGYKKTLQSRLNLSKKLCEIEYYREKIKYRILLQKYTSWITILLVMLGITLSFVGFRLWYLMHQKYQDGIIRNQYDKLNNNE